MDVPKMNTAVFRLDSILCIISIIGLIALLGCKESSNAISDPTGDDDNADDDNDNNDNDDNNNNDIQDDDIVDDDDDDTEEDTDTDTICDTDEIFTETIISQAMILQDISLSMVDPDPSKWQQAKGALTYLLDTYAEKDINFGLDKFPINDWEEGCDVWDGEDPQVAVADCAENNGANLKGIINEIYPTGRTPLYVAMEEFTLAGYAPVFQGDDADSYLILVSDGADSCGPNGDTPDNGATAQQLGELSAKLFADHNIMTIAIGFGTDSQAADQLNAIAANGGTVFTEYLFAENEAQLSDTFDQIVSIISSCIFDIDYNENEVDMHKVNFYFDGEVVPHNENCAFGGEPKEGWTWVDPNDPTQVRFCDKHCEELQTNGAQIHIYAEFGCEIIDIE